MTSVGSEARVRFPKKTCYLLPQCLLNFVIDNRMWKKALDEWPSMNVESQVLLQEFELVLLFFLPPCCLSGAAVMEKNSVELWESIIWWDRSVCAFMRSQSKRLAMSSVGVCLCVHDSADVCVFLSQWAVKIRVCTVNLCQPKIHWLWVPLSTTLHLTSNVFVCPCFLCAGKRDWRL